LAVNADFASTIYHNLNTGADDRYSQRTEYDNGVIRLEAYYQLFIAGVQNGITVVMDENEVIKSTATQDKDTETISTVYT